MKQIKTIAVLLTCHNRKNKTLTCLKSLFDANLPDDFALDIFLVDDGSTDGTSDAIRGKYPGINIIQGNGNLYWNRGMYLAWKTAANIKKYDFYLWLNDDVKLFKNALCVIINDFINNEDSIICGAMLSETDNITTYGGRNVKGNLIEPSGKNDKCYFINGNLVLIPNSVFSKVGMLDSVFPHSIGDFDYGLRAAKDGYSSFISSQHIGYCESNSNLPNWCVSYVPLLSRIKSLYSPLGNSHPYYYSIYSYRHFGLFRTLKHIITIHLRLLLPKLWK